MGHNCIYICRLQRDALPLFNMLRQNYKSSLDREPAFYEVRSTLSKCSILKVVYILEALCI